jgi:hypothetical protein
MALIGAQGGHGSGSGTSGNLLRLREAWRWQWWPARCPGGAALVGPWWLEEDDTVELGMEERRRAHRQRLRRDGDAMPTVVGTAAPWVKLPAWLDGARGLGRGELGSGIGRRDSEDGSGMARRSGARRG